MITRIKWHNHEVLGNLDLNFLKTDGTPYNTIVLAGENGTGKTTILETLATFLNRGSFAPFESIQYDIASDLFTLSRTSDSDANSGFHKRKNEIDGSNKVIRCNRNINPKDIENDFRDIRHYGVAYSKARSGFKVDPIKSSTAEQLDSDKYEIDNRDNFTNIAQLLIDVDTDDSRLWKKISREHKDGQYTYEEFEKISKMSRFKTAFDEFFGVMKFEDIETANGTIRINFKKYGKSIELDHLSTGEKQIVFRGAQLLRNSGNMSDGVVLVDEPELSMHPKWQAKILKYYRDLFTKNGKQLTQMIFATHSEAVLKSALEDKDNVLVIVLKDKTGTIDKEKITAPFVLPVITSAETNYRAFDVVSNDYHIELYGYLQEKTKNHRVDSCDNYIKPHPAYDASKHEKIDSYNGITYETLPTYIRNAIDHPDSGRKFTQDELRCSIELLIELCK